MVGSHPTQGFATILPNPLLDAETSQTWEVGVNTIFKDVALDDDNLSLKVGYFDTRADNYMFSSMDVMTPGAGWRSCRFPERPPSSTTAPVPSSAGWSWKGAMTPAGSTVA